MKSILKATAILSTSSLVTILIGLVSAKFYALFLGPSGVGFMGLLQSLLGLAVLVTGLGLGTGIVRMGAEALEQDDKSKTAALQQAAWLLFWSIGGVSALLLLFFRVPLSQAMLGSPEHAWSVVLVGVALLFTVASGLQVKILNAYQRVGVLAKWGILNSLFGTLVSVLFVWLWGVAAVPGALIASAVVGWLISSYFLHKEGMHRQRSSKQALLQAAASLVRFGLPYTASALVGTGISLLLPVVILHELGQEGVGFYRAAIAISVSYLGFLFTAMIQDYYPRLAAAPSSDHLRQLVAQQHRLVMILGVPIIFGALALAPYLITLVYSPAFYPATGMLEWQLIGDLFKFSSWILSLVILARSRSSVYFFVESVGGVSLLLCSWLAMRWWGLTGLGIGFLASYMIYFFTVALIVKREFGLTLSARNMSTLLVALAVALTIHALPLVGLENWRLPVSLAVACAFGLHSLLSLYAIWRESGSGSPAHIHA